MKKTESLKKSYQFKIVYNKGKAIANRHLVMYVFKTNNSTNRLGVSVSKKVGNSPKRSYITRIIKESYRLSEDKIKKGIDIVIIARVSSNEISYAELNKSFKHLIKKHDLFIKENDIN